jgi:ribulose-bisphosphate carboxylase large chain
VSGDQLRITYQLTCAPGEDPEAKARDIAFEQTVELPPECVPPEIAARVVGRVEALEPLDREGRTGRGGRGERWRAVIAYDPAAVGTEVPQLLNLLFGNISMKSAILVTGVEWPAPLLRSLGGPRFCIPGVRELCGVSQRPLLCTALKPVGLSAAQLAELCYRFALGGIDIIKDDHNLADQRTAPFRERVARCQEAVMKANVATGGRSVYFPQLARGSPAIQDELAVARAAGCRGVMVSPVIVGLDTVRGIAGMAVFAHPSMSGVFFQPDHGILPEVLYGELYRIVGSDGVIYTNAGGRFDVSEATCDAINANLRKALGSLRPAFPVPGGGVDVARAPYWIERYGVDTILLIGGSLYAQGDVTAASRRLLDTITRVCDARSVESC